MRLGLPPRLLVERRHGERRADLSHLRDLPKEVEVAQDERRLREDRAGVACVAQRLPDPAHELVAALDPLVRVRVRPHRDVLALPRRPRQLAPQHLGRVDLDDDLLLEVAPRVQAEVDVGRAGEAVVAHDAVGDEVAGAGGDVVELALAGQRLDRDDTECGIRLQRAALEAALAADRGIDRVHEPQHVARSAAEAHVAQRMGRRSLDDGVEPESPEAVRRPADHLRIGVGDPDDAVRRPLRIEDAGEEPGPPSLRRPAGPLDQRADAVRPVARGRPDGLDRLSRAGRLGEGEAVGPDALERQVLLGPVQRLVIDEREAEPVDVSVRATCALVVVAPDVSVPADHAAEIAAPVVVAVRRGARELARAQQLASDRQMRSPRPALLRAGDVLPATRREEPVIAARDELRPVLEDDPVGRLHGLPVCEHLGPDVVPIGAATLGPVDRVAGPQIGDRAGASVGQQDLRVALHAVHAGMRATSVRVDRPPERHPRSLGHAVQRGLRLDLVEARLQGFGRIEVSDDRRLRVPGQTGPLVLFCCQVLPPHEHMFAYASDGPDTRRAVRVPRPAGRRPAADRGPAGDLRRHPARTRGHGRPRDQSRRALTADARAGRPLHAHRTRVVPRLLGRVLHRSRPHGRYVGLRLTAGLHRRPRQTSTIRRRVTAITQAHPNLPHGDPPV